MFDQKMMTKLVSDIELQNDVFMTIIWDDDMEDLCSQRSCCIFKKKTLVI